MKFLLRLRNPRDYRFQANKKRLNVRVVQRPGLWMSQTELDQLLGELRTVVSSLNIGGLDYGVLSGKKRFTDRAIITLISDAKTGKSVAFNALQALDCNLRGKPTDVFHLGLVVVDPNYRGGGFSWLLYGFTIFLIYLQNRFRPLWVSNVTQVPSIVGMFSETFASAYPSIQSSSRMSYDHLELARQIMERHREAFGVGMEADFDEKRFIIQNAYTGGSDHLKKTFDQAAKHRNPVVNEFCLRELNYARGDDVLQLAQVDLSGFCHYVVRSVPKDSILEIGTRLLFGFLDTLVLPLVQWLTPSTQMGDLRPWKTRKSR
jgi:hypothetical protein